MNTSMFGVLSQYIHYYPLFAFCALLLAGLNLPFSEDLIIISGALICQGDETLLLPCIIFIYFGVLISDFMSYFLGYFVKQGTISAKTIQTVLRHRYTERLRLYLDKYGIWTFIVCRFLPFGVRNTLFMSSGFFGLRVKRFFLYDVIASLISVNTLFWLVFAFGEAAEKPLRFAGITMFFLLAGVIIMLLARLITKHIRKRPTIMITKYGLPQVAVFPGLLIGCMVMLAVFFYPAAWLLPAELLIFVVALWTVLFFRDPPRKTVADENILYAPCDGTVTEVIAEGAELRVSMFLSLFNVHINRVPCSVKVESVTYKKGQYRDARDPEAAQLNEANDLALTRLAPPAETIIVRQVSGAVARHIVCAAKRGDILRQGERFGMIKFGSRTELILSGGDSREICVKPGDKVKAGVTPLIRYTEAK